MKESIKIILNIIGMAFGMITFVILSINFVCFVHVKYEIWSSPLLAKVKIEKAKATAEANKIIGESLKDNELYLRYQWTESLKENNDKIIVIPNNQNAQLMINGKR